MKENIAILGAGAFGTSIATVLANNGHNVCLWCYEKELVDLINNEHENKIYFPGFKLNKNIIATHDLSIAVSNVKFILEAVPVKYLRNILQQLKDIIRKENIFVALSKGIEQDSLFFPTQIINYLFKNKIAVLSGPNFANEIAQRDYTKTILASSDRIVLNELKDIFSNSYFGIELSNDVLGIQVAGALKNVISLLIGIAKGHNIKNNAIAFLITRGLKEIAAIVEYLGGEKETVYGLAGIGDLVLSATGILSRNLKIGKEIGNLQLNKSFDYKKFFSNKVLPEGINTTKSIYQLIKKEKLSFPLCEGIYKLIFENFSFSSFINSIL